LNKEVGMVQIVGSVADISELCSEELEYADFIELRIDLLGERWGDAVA